MKPESVTKLLESSFRHNWHRPALSDYKGETLYYRDIAQSIAKIHLAYTHYGVLPGDKVVICARNQARWAVCFLSALTYGAVPVPLLREFKSGNIHHLVNHSEAKILFVDHAIWDGLNAEDMPGLTAVVRVEDFRLLYLKEGPRDSARPLLDKWFSRRYPDGFSARDIRYDADDSESLAILSYTSGTSGFSKGVMIPYRAVWSNIHFMRSTFPMIDNRADVVAILPAAHMYGMMLEFIFEMTVGCHVHYLSKVPSPKILAEVFADVRPQLVCTVPLIVEKVYKTLSRQTNDPGALRESLTAFFGGRAEEIIVGGAALNPEVERAFRKIRFPYSIAYGMTECAPMISYARSHRTRALSCGTCVPNIDIRIDSPAPHLIPGEVQVRGANVFLGYYKNPDATAEVFTGDGWFRTGDMGILDKDGYLFLRGRTKCMILGASGQNIYPEEIEAVLNNMPYVVHSLVVEDNQRLVGLVYPDYKQAGLDGLREGDLRDSLSLDVQEVNRQLPGYARIARLELMPEDFEMTPKGSIKRYLYQRNRSS